MTPGLLYFSAIKFQGSLPVIALTCPGIMNPSIFTSSALSNASTAGGVSLLPESMEKFVNPFFSASMIMIASAGAVVSNPTLRNITSLSGFSSAMRSASRGE